MDVISELPAEVKQRILECLPIRDAARTAVLSTHWKDAWLRLGRLVFDREFFECFSSRYEDDEEGITNFEICSPKLERYTVADSLFGRKLDESRCFTRYLNIITTLSLSANLLPMPCKNAEIARVTLPTAINLKTIDLYELNVSCPEQLAFALQLVQNSPTLCALRILAFNSLCCCDITMGTRLMEDPNSCIIKQDLKILDTIMISGLGGSTLEMLFVKMLLSKSPALKILNIMVCADDNSEDVNSHLRELLLFPRASPKAQIFCLEQKHKLFLLNNERDIRLLFRTI